MKDIEINGMWNTAQMQTIFTDLPLKAVSTQAKHVFTRGQGGDRGSPMETHHTYRTTGRL